MLRISCVSVLLLYYTRAGCPFDIPPHTLSPIFNGLVFNLQNGI